MEPLHVLMTPTLRWVGPADPVPLAHIRQSVATEVVTALHEVRNGEVWAHDAIAARKAMTAQAGLGWMLVESLPVHEGIRTRSPAWDGLIAACCESLRNLAANGIRVVTYDFMPLGRGIATATSIGSVR